MSEYSFGYGDPGESPELMEQQSTQQGPKWFRDYMDKVSGQLSELKAENDRLKQDQRQGQVANTLKAKGYDPAAAALFTGEPEKLDDWLTTHAAALAKLPAAPGEDGEQTPAGPPASSVPADDQAQMQRMQEAGAQGAAPPQGSDKELAAAINAAQSLEEYEKIMRAHGNRFSWTG